MVDVKISDATSVPSLEPTDMVPLARVGSEVPLNATLETIAQYVTDSGGKVKQVGDPLYFEPLSIAFDKNDPVANATLVAAVSKIVEDMHADGTLSSLSEKWYKTDLTTQSASG